ncbi:hypothetical protein Dsin_021518 [Dipteronia sinensis]|uniref:Protein kinase domain-containing protein n=1 Tax=Dipteronia sinensis TaxID=43782 RepID=A0AAD9ZZP2_9ROSI|nr:hypothetical protein Dsin_021518 [Dipteronia sinensis]
MEWIHNNGIFLLSKNSWFWLLPCLDVKSFVLSLVHISSAKVVWTANRGLLINNSDKFVFDKNGSDKALLWQFIFSENSDQNATWAIILGYDGGLKFYNLQKGKTVAHEAIRITQNSCGIPEPCSPYVLCHFKNLGANVLVLSNLNSIANLKLLQHVLAPRIQQSWSMLSCFKFDQIVSLQRSQDESSGHISYVKVSTGYGWKIILSTVFIVVATFTSYCRFTLHGTQELAYLFEECEVKIVHCYIKPENVLLDDIFAAKVSDFSLAKLMNLEDSLSLTAAFEVFPVVCRCRTIRRRQWVCLKSWSFSFLSQRREPNHWNLRNRTETGEPEPEPPSRGSCSGSGFPGVGTVSFEPEPDWNQNQPHVYTKLANFMLTRGLTCSQDTASASSQTSC